MTTPRRDFLRLLGASGATWAAAAQAAGKDAANRPVHDMSAFPASWTGREQIAMLLYPGFTALDLVGPQYMLGNLMGATVHLVARTLAPCPRDLDLLFVPGGGQGTLKAMQDQALVRWIAQRGARAKWVASVCTGSLLLGQAGLLRGKRATSHWVTHDLLAEFGATPTDRRVVWDGKLVTGAGVSAGLDLGLELLSRLRDDEYAQSVQLLAEYDPHPPHKSGTPAQATPRVKDLIASMFDGLRDDIRRTSRQALPASAG